MQNIVRLDDYRNRRKPPRRAGAPLAPRPGMQYFCTRCDGGEFRLSPGGVVHCAQCGAVMRNLLVSPLPSPEAG